MNFKTKKVNVLLIIALLAIFTLGACTPEGSASGGNPDANGTEVVQEPETEVEDEPEENYPGESEGQLPLVTSFRDTEFGEGLEGYYGFTIVEQMNDGVTAYVVAESQSRNFDPGMAATHGVITFYMIVDHDELLLGMNTQHSVAYNLIEIQERNLGPIDPDSVSDLSFLDESTLAEISEFIHDNFYELSAKNDLALQWDHSFYRFFNQISWNTINNLTGATLRIEGEEMKIQSITEEFLVFNREDSTVKDSQGNLIAQGYRVDHEDDPVYDGQISFEDDDLAAVLEAIRALATEPEMEAPW